MEFSIIFLYLRKGLIHPKHSWVFFREGDGGILMENVILTMSVSLSATILKAQCSGYGV